MGYELVEGVYKYSESPSKEAVAWQGYDGFPGVDKYEDRILKAGTELVKLEPSKSEYFTTKEVYDNLKKNGVVSAITLSDGLQVAPWRNPKTGQYEYRQQVSIVRLNTDIEVAYGEKTLANGEYGKGTFKQIYIVGYDGVNRENNKNIGLEEIGRKKLDNYIISEEQWKNIKKKHEQHLLKRNLFCYQKCKDDLITLMGKTNDVKVKAYCKEQIEEVDKYINDYMVDIETSIKNIGNLKCPTYNQNNNYLLKKTNNHELGKEKLDINKNEDIEKQIEVANENLMKKVEGDLSKPLDKRNINVDELLKAYNLEKFFDLSNEIEKLKKLSKEINKNIQKEKMLNNTLQTKEKILDKAKKNLETIDKYKDIAHKYDNKKIFKKSYQKKHQYEKNLYNQAKNDLKSIGITSWKQYNLEKANFKKLRISIENYKKDLQLSTPNRIELFKKLAPLKNKQINIMKRIDVIDKTKMISRKMSVSLER